MLEEKKTHVEVKKPQIDVRYLADYMGGSEQARRTIVRGCKYRPIARLLQHDDAKLAIAKSLVNDVATSLHLSSEAARVRSKLATDDFDAKKNAVNADYIEQFSEVVGDLVLPKADLLPPGPQQSLNIGRVRVTFTPSIRLARVTRTNKTRVGALMLRYSKGKPLPSDIGEYQSAAIFGCLCSLGNDDGAEVEKALCVTLDAYTGASYCAPGKAVYYFNEMRAVCEGIAERWPAIKPPHNSVL